MISTNKANALEMYKQLAIEKSKLETSAAVFVETTKLVDTALASIQKVILGG